MKLYYILIILYELKHPEIFLSIRFMDKKTFRRIVIIISKRLLLQNWGGDKTKRVKYIQLKIIPVLLIAKIISRPSSE